MTEMACQVLVRIEEAVTLSLGKRRNETAFISAQRRSLYPLVVLCEFPKGTPTPKSGSARVGLMTRVFI